MSAPESRKRPRPVQADGESESSGDETWKLKGRKRRGRSASRTNRKAPEIPPRESEVMPCSAEEEKKHTTQIEVRAFEEFAQLYPQMLQVTQEEAEECARPTRPDKQRTPYLDRLFKTHISRLSRPRYVVTAFENNASVHHPYTQTEIIGLLRARQLLLPTMTASHAQFLLAQEGTYEHEIPYGNKGQMIRKKFTFPPCKHGKGCVAYTNYRRIKGLKEPIVLCGVIMPHELDQLMRHGAKPAGGRPCILCIRLDEQRTVMYNRSHPIITRKKKKKDVNGMIVEYDEEEVLVEVSRSTGFQLFRNLCDEDGGYWSEHMIAPDLNRWEGFVDNLVCMRFSLLFGRYDQDKKRWFVDQSRMMWRPDGLVRAVHVEQPIVGERLKDFQHRSRTQCDIPSAITTACLHATDPREVLLRTAPKGCVASTTQLVLERHSASRTGYSEAELEKLLDKAERAYTATRTEYRLRAECGIPNKDTATEENACYALGVTYDTLLIASLTEERPVHAVYAYCICEDTIYDMVHDLDKCDFWFHSYPTPRPEVKLISKVLPQKCAKRRFQTIYKEFVAAHPRFEDALLGWFVSMLLGNQRSTPHHDRPTIAGRKAVYLMYIKHPQMLKTLMLDNPNVLIWVLRFYLVEGVEDQPAFTEHLCSLFDWKGFSVLTREIITDIRACIVHDITRCMSSMHPFTTVAVDPLVTAVCQRAHERLLDTAYSRMRNELLKDFHILRPTQLVGVIDKPLDDGSRAQIWKWILHTPSPFRTEPIPQAPFTSPKHALQELLNALGVDPKAVEMLVEMLDLYDSSRTGKKLLRSRMHQFADKFPYAYQITRDFCALWKVRANIQCHPLPGNYITYQAQAIRERLDLPPDAPVPHRQSCFWFCWVCMNVYSVVHRYWKPCTKHKAKGPILLCKPHHKIYDYGFNQMILDYDTDEVYCNRFHAPDPPLTDHCIDKDCTDERYNTRLMKVFGIGQMVQFGNELITICPQYKCGRLMVFNPLKCAKTDRGFSCSVCTYKINEERKEKDEALYLHPSLRADIEKKCTVCDKSLMNTNKKNIFLYPAACYLCARHHSENTETAVKSFLLKQGPKYTPTNEDITDIIVKAVEEKRQLWRQLNRKLYQRQHAATRANNRTRNR